MTPQERLKGASLASSARCRVVVTDSVSGHSKKGVDQQRNQSMLKSPETIRCLNGGVHSILSPKLLSSEAFHLYLDSGR